MEEEPSWLLAGEADRRLDKFVKDEHGVFAERGLCARVTDDRTVAIEQLES